MLDEWMHMMILALWRLEVMILTVLIKVESKEDKETTLHT